VALAIYDNTLVLRKVLEVEDLNPAKFACIGNLVEPIVSVDPPLIGTGSSNNPLAISPGADGEVLTTLGGAVSWEAPLSDSVSTPGNYPSGAPTIRHVAVDNGVDEFAAGFRTVQLAAGCVTPGVGPSQVVKAVSIGASGELILDAVSDHVSAQIGTAGSQTLALAIHTLGTVISDSVVGPVVINNPNPCRPMNFMATYDFGSQFAFMGVGTWLWEGRVSVNGGAYVTTASQQFGTFPGLMGLPGVMVGGDNFTIPPSGSRSFSLQNRVTTLIGSAVGSFWNSSSKGLRGLGVTT